MGKNIDEMTPQEINKIIQRKGVSIFNYYYPKIIFLCKNFDTLGIINVFYFGFMVGKSFERKKRKTIKT